MRPMAPMRGWPAAWNHAGSGTCWRSPATGACRWTPPPRAPPRRSPPTCPAAPGRSAPPGPARTAPAGMLGLDRAAPAHRGLAATTPAAARPRTAGRVVAAGAAQPEHRRAGVLPLLRPDPDHPGPADHRRGPALVDRGEFPIVEGPGRSG